MQREDVERLLAPRLFLDGDGDLCCEREGHNLVACPAVSDEHPWPLLNADVWQNIPAMQEALRALLDRAERAEAMLTAKSKVNHELIRRQAEILAANHRLKAERDAARALSDELDFLHHEGGGESIAREIERARNEAFAAGQEEMRDRAVAVSRARKVEITDNYTGGWTTCAVRILDELQALPIKPMTHCAVLAAAPQPALVDRKTLVGVIRKARTAWANDGDGESCPDEAIADALIAAGLRLPGAVQPDETPAWAVVGKDGEISLVYLGADRREIAELIAEVEGKVAVRVAIRRVEDEA